MSYYFVVIGTSDNPLFEIEFGTSKQGGDGMSHFNEEQRRMNQFATHSSLDIVEDVQWQTPSMYLKCIDKIHDSYVYGFLTGGNVKYLLLLQPSHTTGGGPTSRASTSLSANPTSPQTEEAVRQFFAEVYENWVKAIMNPFYQVNQPVRSPIFRQKIAAAAKKYL